MKTAFAPPPWPFSAQADNKPGRISAARAACFLAFLLLWKGLKRSFVRQRSHRLSAVKVFAQGMEALGRDRVRARFTTARFKGCARTSFSGRILCSGSHRLTFAKRQPVGREPLRLKLVF